MASKSKFYVKHYAMARAAGLSDVAARLATVQAALESNYGRAADGNNFHGMKAGKSWTGPKQRWNTHEEDDGQLVATKDWFRAYSSPEESHRDWAKNVARKWPGVLTATNFDDAIAALRVGQQGGYATLSSYADVARRFNREFDKSHAKDIYERNVLGSTLGDQGFLDLGGRTGGRRPIEPDPRYGGPDVRPMPAAMPPMQRSTPKGDRLPRPAAQPDEARWLTSEHAAPEDELLAIRQNFARRLAYENATQPRPVATQAIHARPVAPLPFPTAGLYASPVLPPPPVGSGYDRLLPGTLRVTPPRSAPGGLLRSGGLLGGSTVGLGVFIRDDAVAPKSNGKPARKSGKGKRPVLPPSLY